MTIRPDNIIRPTSVSLIRRDRYAEFGVGYDNLNSKERRKRFTQVLSLVASTRTDEDRSRLDVTKSQTISHKINYTRHPVFRGNKISDHSYEDPTTIRFSGIFTETPFIPYTAADALGMVTRGSLNSLDYTNGSPASRVQEQIQILDRMRIERTLLFVASSIKPIDYMAITKLAWSKRTDTGAAVVVDIELQEILMVDEVRREPIPDSLIAQLGYGPLKSASGS